MISFSTADFFRNIHADKVFLSTQGINELGELDGTQNDRCPRQASADACWKAKSTTGRQKQVWPNISCLATLVLADLDLVISQTDLPNDTLSLIKTQNVQLLLADTHS